jgi:uncharacterized protein involved in response to NO
MPRPSINLIHAAILVVLVIALVWVMGPQALIALLFAVGAISASRLLRLTRPD